MLELGTNDHFSARTCGVHISGSRIWLDGANTVFHTPAALTMHANAACFCFATGPSTIYFFSYKKGIENKLVHRRFKPATCGLPAHLHGILSREDTYPLDIPTGHFSKRNLTGQF